MARLTAKTWNQDFGAIPLANQTPFTGPTFDMVLDDRGNPIVGYVIPSTTGHVSVWDRSTWSAAPDVAGMTEPFMALDAHHAPMVVVIGTPGSLMVQRLVEGKSWELVPAAAAVPPQARHPRIAAGPDGLPVVAYFDAQTISVGLARWTGQRWSTRGTFVFSEGLRVAIDEAPELVVDRQGTAWVSWRETTGHTNLWMSNY
jgi:hypothetical protein